MTMIRSATRRQVLLGSVCTFSLACAPAKVDRPAAIGPDATSELGEIERRLGVFALDTGSGRELSQRADERFAMCSTFKWALAAAILAQVDRGQLSLEERVPYGPSDLLEYAPATTEHVAEGAMTLEALARV